MWWTQGHILHYCHTYPLFIYLFEPWHSPSLAFTLLCCPTDISFLVFVTRRKCPSLQMCFCSCNRREVGVGGWVGCGCLAPLCSLHCSCWEDCRHKQGYILNLAVFPLPGSSIRKTKGCFNTVLVLIWTRFTLPASSPIYDCTPSLQEQRCTFIS